MLDKIFFHYALCFIKYWIMANMLEHFNSKLIVWTLKKQTVVFWWKKDMTCWQKWIIVKKSSREIFLSKTKKIWHNENSQH